MLRYPLSVTLDTNIFDAAKYDFDQNTIALESPTYPPPTIVILIYSDLSCFQ